MRQIISGLSTEAMENMTGLGAIAAQYQHKGAQVVSINIRHPS